MAQWLKILFLLTGLALLGWAIRSVDLYEVRDLLVRLGFGFVLILLVYSVITWVDTVAWKYNFRPEETRNFNLWQLWRIRQIGEAYNKITPLGTLGGEPVKAQLLKEGHRLTFKQGLASQVVAKTTFLTGLIVFFVPGIVFLLQMDGLSEEFKTAGLVGMGVFSTLIFLFFLFQITGALGKLSRMLALFFGVRKAFDQLEKLDKMVSGYYKDHPQRALASVAAAFLGWLIGLGEVYLILHFLGYDPSLAQLWLIEALAQLVRVGTFFIPLSIGAQEGGLILIFSALGYPANLGLTVSFAARIKELIWVTLGLLLSWNLAFKPATVQPDTAE